MAETERRDRQVKGVLESIRRLNKTIIHEDGTLDSFEQQLLALDNGVFDVTKPLIVSPDSTCLSQIAPDTTTPITMRVKTIHKLKAKHGLDLSFISKCPDLLRHGVLAFDSLSQNTSKVILLDTCNEAGEPYIAVIRLNRLMSMVQVHEITSIYAKANAGSFLMRTYQANKTFYKNKKTEQIIKSQRLQLPKEMIFALSNNYSSHIFTKSQVERALIASLGGTPRQKNTLDQTIKSAADRRNGSESPQADMQKNPER